MNDYLVSWVAIFKGLVSVQALLSLGYSSKLMLIIKSFT